MVGDGATLRRPEFNGQRRRKRCSGTPRTQFRYRIHGPRQRAAPDTPNGWRGRREPVAVQLVPGPNGRCGRWRIAGITPWSRQNLPISALTCAASAAVTPVTPVTGLRTAEPGRHQAASLHLITERPVALSRWRATASTWRRYGEGSPATRLVRVPHRPRRVVDGLVVHGS